MSLDSSSPLLTARDIREIAARAGIVPTKTKGQNFLLDPNTVRAIVERAGVKPGDRVLEVGPGLGSLTLGLLDAGAYVGAVELDEALARILEDTVKAKGLDATRLALVNADALRVSELPAPAGAPDQPIKLVANLPYNVATPILLTLLERFDQVTEALVMVQKEVAERIAATPGSKIYGAPSVKAAWYGSRELAGKISRQVFWPVPNVDSALVRVVRDRTPAAGEGTRDLVFSLVDAAFLQRRKTLRAALKSWDGAPRDTDAWFERAGIDPTRRGETLVIEEFIALAGALESA